MVKKNLLKKSIIALIFSSSAYILYQLGEDYFQVGALTTVGSVFFTVINSNTYKNIRDFLYKQSYFTLSILFLFLITIILYPLKAHKRLFSVNN